MAFSPFALARGRSHAAAVNNLSANSGKKWREVDVSNRLDVHLTSPAKIWLPMPVAKTSYQELIGTEWSGDIAKAAILKDPTYGSSFFFVEIGSPGRAVLEVTHKIKLSAHHQLEPASLADAKLFLKPTKHIPTQGLVKEYAHKIVGSETHPDKKAKLIYDWICENTFRDPKVRGCGLGNVNAMLKSGNLSGKCADLSSLFVSLCRTAGVPAREAFGLRVLPSKIAPSLGSSGDVSKAQHCRAEYYSSAHKGWVPVDPADVRKVILGEKLDLNNPRVQSIRHQLFGSWEMNWIAYNSARDFKLPPKLDESVNYLMYPYLVAATHKNDGMDPHHFDYSIQSRMA